MAERLGGDKRKSTRSPEWGKLHVHIHATMAEAVTKTRSGEAACMKAFGDSDAIPDSEWRAVLGGTPRLARLVEQADALIDTSIVADSRLNKKHGWVRSEEGLECDAGRLNDGEPEFMIDRKRNRLGDQATGEPVRIVISTDSTKDACEEHVVAFIAAAKLAQQFRPLEIWWQGAWLKEDDSNAPGGGAVLLAPLIQGDMDFARVEFFLSSQWRDTLSYRCMFHHTIVVPTMKYGGGKKRHTHGFGGGKADYSHLPDTFDFIRESGIKSDPEYIARLAARWAGLEPLWQAEVCGNEASQYWKSAEDRAKEDAAWQAKYGSGSETDAERQKRYKREENEREEKRKREADERLKMRSN